MKAFRLRIKVVVQDLSKEIKKAVTRTAFF